MSQGQYIVYVQRLHRLRQKVLESPRADCGSVRKKPGEGDVMVIGAVTTQP